MGSGGRGHKFWCDKCQCYVDFSDFETCESVCGYCEARENKARAEAAEAEVGRLRAELAAMPRPENRCHGEWPCEASTALAFAEAEMARAEAHTEAAEAEAARLRAEAAEQLSDRAATFVQECGYLVGIEVYSPDDIPVIAERLGALHTRAEAAEARGAAAERAAVGAWLRSEAFVMEFRSKRNLGRRLADVAADAIERGEHLEKT